MKALTGVEERRVHQRDETCDAEEGRHQRVAPPSVRGQAETARPRDRGLDSGRADGEKRAKVLGGGVLRL